MQSTSSLRNQIILILCLISTLGRFALDSYLPSFPAIAKTFLISPTETERTLTFYLLGFGLSQLVYGPLSDRYGRKKILLWSFVIFAVGNLFCALSTTIDQLLICRFVSGIGGGATGVLNRAIAADHFKGPAFAKAWSYTTTTLVLTLILAPLIGGQIQNYFGWQGNFILMAAVITLSFFIVLKFLPESNENLQTERINIKEILINYKRLLLNKSYILSLLCYIFAFSGLIAFFQISPFLFIKTMGLSTSQFACLSLIVAGGYLVGGILVNRFSPKFGVKKILLAGILLLIIGGIGMLSDIAHVNIPVIMIPAIVFIIGARLVIPNATASAMTDFTHNRGSASALIGSLQIIGTAAVSYVMSTVKIDSQLPLGIAFTSFGFASIVCFIFLFYRQKQTVLSS
jgi:Bcr/CflA subfamily drug resistance transporter